MWVDSTKTQHHLRASPELLTRDIQNAKRIRVGYQYKAQRNYHGLYWFAQTGRHVWYESLFEMTALMSLDFHFKIRAISSQPMMMQFTSGKLHVPDLMATHANGQQVVYDVRPDSLITPDTEVQFAETKRICDTVGWEYQLFTAIDPIVKNNLEWLAGYRHARHTPRPHITKRVLAAARTPQPFADLAHVVNDEHPSLGAMALYSLLWNRDLTFDMTLPLTTSTIISKDSSK